MSYPSLKITFLGTGTSSGVPMIGCTCDVCKSTNKKDNRLRSSILVQSANTTIVIDTTPDFRYQMLRTHTKQVDAIIFTHPHKDHIAGLDDVKAFNFITNKPMPLYANALTAKALERDFYYAFAENRYPGSPNLQMNIIDQNSFVVGDISVQPILVWHLNLPVYGFKFGDFTYITDANKIDAEEKEKIIGSKIVVLNALRKEKHISHFTLSEAITMGNELKAEQVYFTHISHQLGLHEEINNELPKHIQLAYDGLVITT